ncbi:ferritin-like domain-containing protein [Halobaculum sp. MBLA0147]|uniref:ferritin-like domain-containing protein n=1 Tax=Halobaculum sp. MBLA0147 TaxID=3079934 RepID=UPI003523FDD3
MSVGRAVASDRQLARLLQIGVVLEEMVEASAHHHTRQREARLDAEVVDLLEEAAAESATHRERLEGLIAELDAESVAYEEIETLVEAQYAAEDEFDDVLYDQLCNEETAYKFYDDLLAALADSESELSVDRDRVVETLEEIRAEEAEGVEEVADMMERRA